MQRVLERAGYQVLVAADGVEALAVCRAHQGELAALILDVAMPRLGGDEVLRTLVREQPNLKILMMSGGSISSVTDNWRSRGAAGFLGKPFRPLNLLTELDGVLGTRPQGQ